MVKRVGFLCGDVDGISFSWHGRFGWLKGKVLDNHVGLFGISFGNKQIGTATTIKTLVNG